MEKSNRAKTKKTCKIYKAKLENLLSNLEKEIQSEINSLKKEIADFQSLIDAIENDEVVIHTNRESFLEAGRKENKKRDK